MHDQITDRICRTLENVPGVSAIVLGGSRARGTAGSSSDYDIGIYYEPADPLDVEALKAAVRNLVDDPEKAAVTGLGGWGPWINGGGWLTIEGRKVDLLYRDLERVRAIVAECSSGTVTMNYQPGHPHGFVSAIWMGEVALCVPLVDHSKAIADLKNQVWPYPAPLKKGLIERFLWEARFSVENAEIAVPRNDSTHVAGCLYRALACVAQVFFALNERYLINEKGALAEVAEFPVRIDNLTHRLRQIWSAIGAGNLDRAISLTGNLVLATETAVGQKS
jgi:hypothetical protein